MKKFKNYQILPAVLFLVLVTSCDPNKEIYDALDAMKGPFKRSVEYTLTEADYISLGGIINTYKAFNDTIEAKNYIPGLLSQKFRALNLGSSALVSFNHLMLHPIWWDAGFGYELTFDDYAYIGVDNAFSQTNPASQYLPNFLLKQYPDAQEGANVTIIFNFSTDDGIILNLEVYQFSGTLWELIETIEDIPYVGYEMTSGDYEIFGGSIASYHNFSSDNDPDLYLPAFLKYKFPFDPIHSERVIKYKYFQGGQNNDVIDHYTFDGVIWNKTSSIEQRTEQYVFGENGWAFDPTVTIELVKDDYMYMAIIDPIPHPYYNDFGYYYGASAYYSNFDIRLLGRRLNKNDDGSYVDPELGEIYDNEGTEAAMNEMLRRIVEEAFILLLQYKYPNAVPQVGGVDVHYILQFETFADNFIRSYPEAEYQCVEAGNPPQFILIEGPRDRP
jgi:hypothetical protein